MPINSSYTLADAHTQADGRRYIEHIFVDHLGIEHRQPLRLVPGHWSEFDYTANRANLVDAVEKGLAATELSAMLHDIQLGKNPLRDSQNNPVDPKHQTRAEAITKILKYVGNLSGEDLSAFKAGFDFLGNLTQPEVESMGFNWAIYTQWLSKASALKNALTDNTVLGGD